MKITVEQIAQFIVLLCGGVGVFYNLKARAEKNTIMIENLKENFLQEVEETKQKIQTLESEHRIAYTKLDNKITMIDSEIKGVAQDTAEIKGFIKSLANKMG